MSDETGLDRRSQALRSAAAELFVNKLWGPQRSTTFLEKRLSGHFLPMNSRFCLLGSMKNLQGDARSSRRTPVVRRIVLAVFFGKAERRLQAFLFQSENGAGPLFR